MQHRDERPAPDATPTVGELIAAERAAYRRHDAACGRCETSPDDKKLEAEEGRAGGAQLEAFAAVMSATPASADDAIAMINLFRERDMQLVGRPVSEHLDRLFARLEGFILSLEVTRHYQGDDAIAHAAGTWHANADAFNATDGSNEEADRAFNVRADAAEAVLRSIIARGLIGLQAKAGVLKRMLAGSDAETIDEPNDDDIGSLTWSLVDDLLRLRPAAPVGVPAPLLQAAA